MAIGKTKKKLQKKVKTRKQQHTTLASDIVLPKTAF